MKTMQLKQKISAQKTIKKWIYKEIKYRKKG